MYLLCFIIEILVSGRKKKGGEGAVFSYQINDLIPENVFKKTQYVLKNFYEKILPL